MCCTFKRMVQNLIMEIVSGLGVGGAEKALVSRLRNSPTGFDAIVINLRPSQDLLQLNPNTQIIQLKTNVFSFLPRILRIFREFQPQIIIVRTPLDAIRFSLLKAVLPKHSWKLVFEAHSNFTSSKRYLSTLFRISLRLLRCKMDKIIAVSKNVQAGPLCESSPQSTVIYLGADKPLSFPKFQRSYDVRLLYVGRLVPIKRPIHLLIAISKIKSQRTLPDKFLTIVGDGELRNEIETFIAQNDLKNVVVVEGYQENVSRFMNECTHLISVSTNEGLPISFFEAKLSGMRIVSTPSGGGHEVFDELDKTLPSFELDDLVFYLDSIVNDEVTGISRLETAENSSWMDADICATKYYSTLENLLEN
jgi:glycosyltransferase involved in cell wall biosynthesis